MRIKFRETIGTPGKSGYYEAGKAYTFPDDNATAVAAAKRYIGAEIAEAAPDLPAADVGAELKGVVQSLVKQAVEGARDGATEGAKSKRPVIHQGEFVSEDKELAGIPVFGSCGGFLHHVKAAAAEYPEQDTIEKMNAWRDVIRKSNADPIDKGMVNTEHKAPSGNFESNDPDGGALVIPEFSQTIFERMQLEENFMSDSDVMVIRGNTMVTPGLDDASRANGSRWGGIQGLWAAEAAQYATVSKPTWRQIDQRLHKLYIFAYMTDELLSDSPYALESYVAKYAAKECVFKINDAMVNGNGGGMPQGIVGSSAVISVTTPAGQATKTLITQNINDMWMRLNAYCRGDSVWLINQDCESALQSMGLPVGIAGSPTYLPPGGLSGAPYGTLKGRPVKIVEFCQTLGTNGDIILTSWSHYKCITKGGIKSDISMHVRFQYGEMAYRFTFRMDGQPLWDKPLTPYNGTTTTSSIVTLAAR